MFCRYQGCIGHIKAACQTCQENKFLCGNHYWIHLKETKHKIITLEDDDISILIKHKYNLDSKISNCIFQITQDTNHIISALTNAAKNAIGSLKMINSNLDDISQFTEVVFNKNRVSLILNEIGLICTEMRFFPEDQIKILSDESKFYKTNIESLTNSINNLKIQISQKDSMIKDLKTDLYKNDEIQIKKLSDKSNIYRGKIKSLKNSINNLKIQISQKDSMIKDLKTDLYKNDEIQIKKLSDESNIYRGKIKSLKNLVNELNLQITEKDSIIKDLKTEPHKKNNIEKLPLSKQSTITQPAPDQSIPQPNSSH